jgi:hypothetical protein
MGRFRTRQTRDLDRFGFVKRPAGAITWLTRWVDPWPGQDPVFLFLFKCGFCPSVSLLISWYSLQWVVSSSREERRVRDAAVGGWSGWSPVSVGGGSGLAKRRRRLGKKKEGLSSCGQKTRGWLREGWGKLWPGSSSHAAWRNAF